MKISFPDSFVKSTSFIDLCNIVKDYGFDGIEICDINKEKSAHLDSLFRSSYTVDAKRKLVNRHISVSAISYPTPISSGFDNAELIKYVEYASNASVDRIIVKFSKIPSEKELKEIYVKYENSNTIPADDYETWTDMFESYEGLHGNGTFKMMDKEMKKKHIV